MFKKRKAYTNQLTELITSNPNVGVETILSHEQLSITIRNEAPAFLEYFFPEDELQQEKPNLPHFKEVIKYALKGKEHQFEDDDSPFKNTYLVSENAASFLSSPSKKLNEYINRDKEKRLYKKLRKFIFKKESSNSKIAGNFTRIFIMLFTKNPEEFLDKDNYTDDFSLEKLTEFCVNNIEELAYAELLERFLTTEFEIENIEQTRTRVLYQILQKVRNIIGAKIESNELDDDTSSYTIYMNDRQKVESHQQPSTSKLDQYPYPKFISLVDLTTPKIIKTTNDAINLNTSDLIPITKDKIGENIEKNKLIAYTLLNVIWSSGNESPAVFELIQNQMPENEFSSKKRILEYLLLIGIFGISNLMLSSTAFRILNIIINGDEKMEIQRINNKSRKGRNKDGDEYDIINFYANFVVFDVNNLSNLAVLSFPIFYDHVYKEIKCESDSKINYIMKDIRSKFNKNEGNKVKRRQHVSNKHGLTPFVYLTPIALSEPPLSTELTSSYCKIFESLVNERQKLMDILLDETVTDQDENFKALDRIKDIDDFYLDYVSYKFEYPDLPKKYNIFEITEELFPINPRLFTKDKLKVSLKKEEIKKIQDIGRNSRPLLNSAFVKMTGLLLNHHFLTYDGFTLISKDPKLIQPPLYSIVKITGKDGETYSDEKIRTPYEEYIKILENSKDNKNAAGPRDDHQELNGE